MVDLIEKLGVLLVDTSSNQRELGTLILTQVIENIPPDFLKTEQLTFICGFYSDRLKDHHQVILKNII